MRKKKKKTWVSYEAIMGIVLSNTETITGVLFDNPIVISLQSKKLSSKKQKI